MVSFYHSEWQCKFLPVWKCNVKATSCFNLSKQKLPTIFAFQPRRIYLTHLLSHHLVNYNHFVSSVIEWRQPSSTVKLKLIWDTNGPGLKAVQSHRHSNGVGGNTEVYISWRNSPLNISPARDSLINIKCVFSSQDCLSKTLHLPNSCFHLKWLLLVVSFLSMAISVEKGK